MKKEKEAVISIDGNNLYHNLKAMQIKPSDLDFQKFTNYIAKHFNCSIKKVLYYNSKPDIREGEAKYYRHMSYMSEIGKIPKFEVKLRKLQTSPTKEIQKEAREAIDELELCDTCSPIVKKFLEDSIGRVKMKEKGVDILLVVDMIDIAIINNEDIACILVSGDADFIPALDILKRKGKEVFTASVVKGYARNLRQKFPYLILNRKDITENCLKKGSE